MKHRNLILGIAIALAALVFVNDLMAKSPRAAAKNDDILSEKECLNGIDLSHHNGISKWRGIDVDFVYLKATEGSTHTDTKFHQYRDSCLAHGIPVGAYHFFSTASSGEKQFLHFQKVVGNTTNLIPVIDVEVLKGKWTSKKLRSEVVKFIELCQKEYGVTPIIYTSDIFYTKNLKSAEIDKAYLWLGDVNVKRTRLKNPHIMHQHSIGKVSGIPAKVDRNRLYVPLDSITMPLAKKQ